MEPYRKDAGLVDIILQGILYVPTLFFHLMGLANREFVIIALIIQIPLGFYQVGSGLFGWRLGRAWKKQYLLVVLFYFVILGMFFLVADGFRYQGEYVFFLIGLIIIPMAIGGWHWMKTIMDFNRLGKLEEVVIKEKEYDLNILDADYGTLDTRQ